MVASGLVLAGLLLLLLLVIEQFKTDPAAAYAEAQREQRMAEEWWESELHWTGFDR